MARKELWSWVKTLLVAVVLALILRQYVLAFFVVDGSSMLPTLKDGQMVAVNKLAYRIGSLKHGDVAVFEAKKTAIGPTEKRVLIKRIIALPGDTIAISAGKVLLNGEELREDYTDVLIDTDMELLLIEEGQVFVMGDNRNPRGSWDSREFGPIPMDSIMGKAFLIIYPIPKRVK
jgi:signal peptidase I